jgi:hypothetical protein
LDLVKHFIQGFDLRHVAQREEFLELHLANIVLGNQFSIKKVNCLLNLRANHIFVRDCDLYLANGLDLG